MLLYLQERWNELTVDANCTIQSCMWGMVRRLWGMAVMSSVQRRAPAIMGGMSPRSVSEGRKRVSPSHSSMSRHTSSSAASRVPPGHTHVKLPAVLRHCPPVQYCPHTSPNTHYKLTLLQSVIEIKPEAYSMIILYFQRVRETKL